MKILLVGEYCVDEYVYGITNRLSPEAPVPVLTPEKTFTTPGMVGNVFKNLKALKKGIQIDHVFFKTDIKTRYVDKITGYQLLRVDTKLKKELSEIEITNLSDYDAVVIVDYNKGFITKQVIKKIIKHPLVFVDSKKTDLRMFKNAIIKVNKKESTNITNINKYAKLIITLGEDGALWNNNLFPVSKVPIRDLTGAGDTFLAALCIKYLETKNIPESIKWANTAASIAVTKPGTAVVTCGEVNKKEKW